MPTDWDDSYAKQAILTGLRAPLPNNKKTSLFNRVLGNINKYLNDIPDDKKNSIDIIFETLRHIKKYNINTFTVDPVTNEDTNEDTNENTNENTNKEYEESMKRLINITSYKMYIKKMYYADQKYDTNINEEPQVSLENLINTLRDIVNNEALYNSLIHHLQNIKSESLTINKIDKTLKQSGGNNKQYKEIFGKRRRIYKIKGSRKEHIKYKGELIPVSDYKKLFKK